MYPGIPVTDIQQAVSGDVDVSTLRGERGIGPRIDQPSRSRRDPVGDFLRRELVLDVEDAHPGNVVGREDGVLAAKRSRAILVQIMWTERAQPAVVPILWSGQRGDRHRILRRAYIQHKRVKHALGASLR